MPNRIGENGAVQQAITDANALVAAPSRLAAAGYIAATIKDHKTANITTKVSGLTAKGRLINKWVAG